MKRLLRAVEGKHYELGVWIQLFAGFRIGEVQALRWEDLDLEAGAISVRRTFVRKRNCIRDCPKGKKQFTLALPPELWEKLKSAKGESVKKDEFVVRSLSGTMLQYKSYLKALRAICRELGLSRLGTHGLRHTTTSLYMQHGASKDDMRELFSHSSGSVCAQVCPGQARSIRSERTGWSAGSLGAGSLGRLW
jgi:integrase